MNRRLLLALSVLVPCSGCASMATQARVARSSTAMSGHEATPGRRVFTSRLSAGQPVPSLTPTPPASQATGTVKIVLNDDDTFEYLATIYNPMGEAFTGAVLQRGAQRGEGDEVATFFSDVMLRSRYIQLRGTMSVARGSSAATLAEDLRENPRAFTVNVWASNFPLRVAIRGVIE